MQRHEGVLGCVGILNHNMGCILVWVSPRVGREDWGSMS